MRTADLLKLANVRSLVALCVLLAAASSTLADDANAIKIKRSITLNEVGDAKVKIEVKMSAEGYTNAKANNPNTAVLLRRLGAGNHWMKVENVRGQFDDNAGTVVIEYTQLSLARMSGDDLWKIALDSDTKHELLGAFDNNGILTTTAQTDLGAAAVNLRIEAPKAAKELTLLHNPERVTYRFTPPAVQGTKTAASFTLDVKAQIMTAMAKSYSDQRLAGLWVARSVFKNTGDQTISDYRVRFRLPGYSNFGEWKRLKRVLPGQTVVDPYFPVFELEKMGQIASSRPISVEVEYEYRQQDGRTVRESDSRQVQLLGRNQVVYSSLAADEAVGFFDKYNNAPVILTSLVAGKDSVMEDLAGRLSKLSGGTPAQNDDDAQKFVTNLYLFLGNNNVTYQAAFGQDVKFGRDVIRTHSGSCVDLAVLFASACDAAGLKPLLYLTATDCIPAVRLPGGQIVKVDLSNTTGAAFAKATEEGRKKVQEAQAKSQLCEIDVAKWRGLGAANIDLQQAEENFLEKNYRFVAGTQSSATPTTSQPATSGNREVGKLAGTWLRRESPDARSVQYTLNLSADGKYTYRAVVTSGGQTSETQESGTFQVGETTLKFVPSDGKPANVYFYRLRADELDLQLQDSPTLVTFQRGK